MKTHTFESRLEVPVGADELFAWHARPGAFERLSPPWETVELEGPPASIVDGAVQRMRVRIGPLAQRWVSRIEDVQEGKSFRDVSLAGPFRSWSHTHAMEPAGSNRSTLIDRVEYSLPGGALGGALGGRFVTSKIERLFAYRHRVTSQELERIAESPTRPLVVLVTGSSGMVGRALVASLTTAGHQVRRLVRHDSEKPDEFTWDPTSQKIDSSAVEGADAVVHLAGENIAGKRWSATQKERIRSSRVEGTRLVADAVREAQDRPSVFISASAVGWYGDRGDEELLETSEPGDDFLANVCRAWEDASSGLAGVRSVQLRFGVVLSPAGGALRKMLLPFRLGGGGRIGSGQQWMSWVALDDVLGAVHHALGDDSLSGPLNVVAPNPVRNAEFTKGLGRALRRPTIVPMPAFAARGAFGELADALLLASQRVVPQRLLDSGFSFGYPELGGALGHLLGK